MAPRRSLATGVVVFLVMFSVRQRDEFIAFGTV